MTDVTQQATMLANRGMPNTGKWQDRHDDAILNHHAFSPFQQPIVDMLKAWTQYAEDHKGQYDSVIGDDGVLGPEWEAIGDALRGLLNGQTGQLDCGTLDGFILNTMSENGVDVGQK
jgi:hypothetical protein